MTVIKTQPQSKMTVYQRTYANLILNGNKDDYQTLAKKCGYSGNNTKEFILKLKRHPSVINYIDTNYSAVSKYPKDKKWLYEQAKKVIVKSMQEKKYGDTMRAIDYCTKVQNFYPNKFEKTDVIVTVDMTQQIAQARTRAAKLIKNPDAVEVTSYDYNTLKTSIKQITKSISTDKNVSKMSQT